MTREDKEFLLNDGKPVVGWYVYGWVNADWGGAYFYVGKGHGQRYKETEKRGMAFKAIYRNWECFPVVIEDGLTEEEAERREAEIKEFMIFDKGFPIMDGEGHSESLKHLAIQRAKREKRMNDPNWHEGRKALEIPEDFEWYKLSVGTGEITVTKACEELGISRSTWYKWTRTA